jgi:hypothetical protein
MVADIMVRFELACYFNPRFTLFGQRELLKEAPERTRARRSVLHWNSMVNVSGKRVRIGNNPDQFFAVFDHRSKKLNYFFLEADRGTETVRPQRRHLNKSTIYRKLLGYYHTHKNRLHKTVFGEHMRNFRVLWVIDSDGTDKDGNTRLDNMLVTTQEVTGGTLSDLFLFIDYRAFQSDDLFDLNWLNGKGELRQIN